MGNTGGDNRVEFPLWAMLSDRIGRRPVFIFGALACAVMIWPTLWAISRADVALVFLFGILLSGVVYSAANGTWPSLYGEMFDTRVRLSGMAIGTQIGFALGGLRSHHQRRNPRDRAERMGLKASVGTPRRARSVVLTAGIAAGFSEELLRQPVACPP